MDQTNRMCVSSDDEYPILVIPKKCTTLETNYDVTDNVFIDVKIVTPDTEGNETCVYSGYCNIKLIDSYDVNVQGMRPREIQEIEDLPVILADQEQSAESFEDNNGYWGDPGSPDIKNVNQDRSINYSVCQQSRSKHITVQQHNTYITQNVYNFNKAVRYTPHDELASVRKLEQTSHVPNNLDAAAEYTCGTWDDTPTPNILDKNVDEPKYRDEADNEALKQLMSSDFQSLSKQRRTIMYLGPDVSRGQTIQQIAYTDPALECCALPTEVENEVVIESAEPIPPNLKKYQCAKCHQIFEQLSAFRNHMGNHASSSHPKEPRASRYSLRSETSIKYICSECGKTLKDQHKFELHCLAHGDPELECPKCGKVFASKFTCRVHQKIHNRKYRCNVCERSYAELSALKAHMAKFHCLFACDACDFVASKNSELLAHEKSHENIYSFDVNENESSEIEFGFYEEDVGNAVVSPTPSRIRDWICENYESEHIDKAHGESQNSNHKDLSDNNNDLNVNDNDLGVNDNDLGVDDNDTHMDDNDLNVVNTDLNERFDEDGRLMNENIEISEQHTPNESQYGESGFKEKLEEVETDAKQLGRDGSPPDEAESQVEDSDEYESQFDGDRGQFDENGSQFGSGSPFDDFGSQFDEDDQADIMDDKSSEYNRDSDDSVIAKAISNKAFLSKKSRRFSKVCDVCLKRFDRISDLKRHLIEHVIRSTLAKMPVSHTGILSINCEVCHAAVFQQVDQYKAHLREHAKLTLYQCTFCNKSFSDSSNFSKHKKIHGATYFQCDLCQRKFNSKKMLAHHMDYHSENSPLPCPYCKKKFHFESTLNKHIKGSHTKKANTRFRCRFCLKHFVTLKTKWDHEWTAHRVRKMIVDCLICGSKYRKYSELKRHCHERHGVGIPSAKSLLTSTKKKAVSYKKP